MAEIYTVYLPTQPGKTVEGLADRLAKNCILAKQLAVAKTMATDQTLLTISLPK